ncbi:cardiolipin synthase [bacterium F11]|nr:cardiolipin synthase [bacterium F11]
MVSWHLQSWHIFTGSVTFLISVFSSSHAILRRKDPRAALWWMAVIWFVPFIGAVLYYLFGINRIKRKARRKRSENKPPVDIPSPPKDGSIMSSDLPRNIQHLIAQAHLVDQVVENPLIKGNRVVPFVNGDEAYPQMLEAIEKSKQSISLMTYLFKHDCIGKKFIQALGRAVTRKVKVRVLVDGMGSGFEFPSILNAFKSAKIKAAFFNPTLALWRMSYVNLRNHRKCLIIDGKEAFTGGMNIFEGHSLGLNPRFPTQDIQFKIEGPVAAQLQDTFREDWYFATKELIEGDDWYPSIKDQGTTLARAIKDGPDENFEKCRWVMLGALTNAVKSIKVVTPYFVPDQTLITTLNLAAMSGIRVDIVLPQINNQLMVKWASMAMLWQVLEKGCHVWITPPPFDHSKLMVVDGGWSFIGSTNWDERSLRLNFELNVECYDEELAKSIDHIIEEKIKKAKQLTLADVDGRPLSIKLRDGVARLFSPHL